MLTSIRKRGDSWVAEDERRGPDLMVGCAVTPVKREDDALARQTALKCLAGPALYAALELFTELRSCTCNGPPLECLTCVGRKALRQAREGVTA